MNHKEAILQAAISLIDEKKDPIKEITMREISKRAGVGLGLINYHFENKEKLIEVCVERIIHEIVEKFRDIGAQTTGKTPFEKLDYLGNLTLTFLLEHPAVSKISILSDLRFPQKNDNTQRTIQAYLPFVSECRPDWQEDKVYQVTFSLISCMQLAFLRREILLETQGIDLKNPQDRKEFHTKMLNNILRMGDMESGAEGL